MPELSSRKAAVAAGLKTYFTGKPCPKGHFAERYVANYGCAECMKAYVEDSAEKRKAAAKVWAKRNPEKVSAYSKRYRDKDLDKSRLRYRVWYEANKERAAENHKRWTQENLASVVARNLKWRDSNRGRSRVHGQNRRKRAVGRLSPDLVGVLMRAQQGVCACPCRADLANGYHLDHITALSNGGLNVDENIQLLTPRCNQMKASKDNETFMAEQRRIYENT